MRTTAVRLTALAALLAAPMIVAAQGPARGGAMVPAGPRPLPDASVTHILNARRALDLTPRQVAQLDSIERSLFAERRSTETRLRALRDSIRTQMMSQGAPANDAERAQRRDALRTRLEALRPQMQQLRGRDSTARAAAGRVLNDAQRQQLREMQAEERGRQRGMREARMRGGRGGPAGSAGVRGEMRRREMMERAMGPGARTTPRDRMTPAQREERERRMAPRPDTDA